MAITLVTNPYTGTAYTVSTSATFAITFNQVSYNQGDMIVGLVAGKPYNTTFSIGDTDGTWTSIGSFVDGSVASGVDTGSVKVQAFYRIATTDSSGPDSVTSSVSSGRITAAIFFVVRSGTGYFQTPVGAGAFQPSATGYDFMLTSPAVLPVDVGDFVFGSVATKTNLYEFDVVVSGFTAGGSTLPGYADDIPHLTTLQSTVGNHLSMYTMYDTIPSAFNVPGNLGVFGYDDGIAEVTNVVAYCVRLREGSPPGGLYDPFGTLGVFGI